MLTRDKKTKTLSKQLEKKHCHSFCDFFPAMQNNENMKSNVYRTKDRLGSIPFVCIGIGIFEWMHYSAKHDPVFDAPLLKR